MKQITVPNWVKKHNTNYHDNPLVKATMIKRIKGALARLQSAKPEVSIIIPAYNEEEDILKTLSSLTALELPYPIELIVVNNNSTDHTQALLDECGVTSYLETKQGVTYARQKGLEMAKGTYILSADADSIYPKNWGLEYITALKTQPNITCVYGRYSFIPSSASWNARLLLSLHEVAAETMFDRRKVDKYSTEAANVMGFNFAYRKADGLKVGGFEPTKLHGEDGWMALQLMKFGKLQLVKTQDRVWTSDRRLLDDGSLGKAFLNRVKRHISKFNPIK